MPLLFSLYVTFVVVSTAILTMGCNITSHFKQHYAVNLLNHPEPLNVPMFKCDIHNLSSPSPKRGCQLLFREQTVGVCFVVYSQSSGFLPPLHFTQPSIVLNQ